MVVLESCKMPLKETTTRLMDAVDGDDDNVVVVVAESERHLRWRALSSKPGVVLDSMAIQGNTKKNNNCTTAATTTTTTTTQECRPTTRIRSLSEPDGRNNHFFSQTISDPHTSFLLTKPKNKGRMNTTHSIPKKSNRTTTTLTIPILPNKTKKIMPPRNSLQDDDWALPTTPLNLSLELDPVTSSSLSNMDFRALIRSNNQRDSSAGTASHPHLGEGHHGDSERMPLAPAMTHRSTGNAHSASVTGNEPPPPNPPTEMERRARIRWIRINRRFQLVITVVALLFSLLLFAVLICWVVLASAFILSYHKSCDVPLKQYFWMVTLQLILDVFRSDIMRLAFHWDPNSNQRIPTRVIAYNVMYLVYALVVMRLGISSVFNESNTCQKTATELYNASTAFVSLSIAAWTTIICGYLVPFCVVAAVLTLNGYNPTSHNQAFDDNLYIVGAAQTVFPSAYATTGAPPGTVDKLVRVALLDAIVGENGRECCICMEEFTAQDWLVKTPCKHVFHKPCCREWLRQARTCPVCRLDIPGSLQQQQQQQHVSDSPMPLAEQIPMARAGRPFWRLVRILERTAARTLTRNHSSSPNRLVGGNTNNNNTTQDDDNNNDAQQRIQ